MRNQISIQRAAIFFLVLIFCISENVTAQGSDLWLSAGQNRNNTRNATMESIISVSNVSQLGVKWAFTTAGDVSATPAVDSTAVYFPDNAGFIYKVNVQTGAKIWSRQVKEFTGQNFNYSRNTPLITGNRVIFGTQFDFSELGSPNPSGRATLICLNKNTGDLLWQTQIDDHPASIVTQSAVAYGNTVYVGVSSQEEYIAALVPGYQLSFRGSLVALNKNTGAIESKTYMTPGSGFTGCAVWGSTPVIDPKRGSIYITTGNNYGVPQAVKDTVAAGIAAGYTEAQIKASIMSIPGSIYNYVDAVVAMDLNTLAIKWANNVIPYDAFTAGCLFGGDCPEPTGPDFDFGQGPALFTTMVNGKKMELLGAGQKSGQYWALNPDNGNIVWSTQVSPGGFMGGMQWGSATDGVRIYTAASNSYFIPHTMGPGPKNGQTINGGFWSALDAGTGEVLWENTGTQPAMTTIFGPPPAGAFAMNQGPVTVANGVMYAGALDLPGTMYAFNAATGDILWSFASGASVNSGAAVVKGVVYWGSGYSGLGGLPGTHLYAFSLPSLNKAGVEENSNPAVESPKEFSLNQNYPNPFNPTTQIRFSIPEESYVTLKIYNNTGQIVKTLVDNTMSAGVHQVTWDATDNGGNKLAGGIYFYKLNAGTYTQTHKMLLLK